MKNILIVLLSLSITNQTLCSSWDNAQESLKNLRTTYITVFNEAFNSYINLFRSVESTVEFVVSSGTAEITTTSSKHVNQYNEIKQSAETVNITGCLSSYEEAIINLGPEMLTSFEECVQSEIDTPLIHLSSRVQMLISQYWENSAILQEKNILRCGPLNDDCLQTNIVEINRISGTDSTSISYNYIFSVEKYFGMFLSPITTCREKFVAINSGKGKSLVEGFKSCVNWSS